MSRIPKIAGLLLTIGCLSLFAQPRELRVVAATPAGAVSALHQSQTIIATFSEPMTALQAVPKDESAGPLIIEPKIKGKFRWMGTLSLAFIPDQPLPYATKFTLKIPAGTASLRGKTLQKDYIWSFETPRPMITWTSPRRGGDHIDTNVAVFLRFNQPVDAQTASKYISVRVERNGTSFYPSFSSRNATPADSVKNPEQMVILKTAGGFGCGASIHMTIKDGLQGIEGMLPMTSSFELEFSTFDQLVFLGIDDPSDIYPQSGIRLLFSNDVTSKAVLQHLSFTPALKSRKEYYDNQTPSSKIYVPLPLAPDSTYRGVLKAGLVDRHGTALKKDIPFTFHVRSYQPFVRTRTGIGILEGYESHKFPISTMNVDSVRVQMGVVDPEAIVPVMRRLSWDYYHKMAWEKGILLTPISASETAKLFAGTRTIATRSKRNIVCVRPLDFDDVLGKGGRGTVFVQVDDMDRQHPAYLKTLVQVTNFGITAKFSPESNLIWVTNLKDASPVANASVEIRTDSNLIAWKGITDDKGLVKTPGWGKLKLDTIAASARGESADEMYEDQPQPRQWVIVRKGKEIAFTSSEWNEGIQPYRFDIEYDWRPQVEKYEGTLFTDRGLYKANETVEVKGIVRVRSEASWKIYPKMRIRLIVKDAKDEEIYTQEQHLSPFGSFAASIPLKPGAALGYYSMRSEYMIKVKGKEEWRNLEEGTFRVEAFRAAEFEIIAKFNADQYVLGDTAAGFITAKYLFGSPLKNEKVRWRFEASRSSFTPPGQESYFFGRLSWLSRYQNDFFSRELQNKDTTLDAFGTIAVHSPIRVGEFQGPVSLMLEGEVTSPSRQTLSGRTSVLFHGGEYYIGVRPSSTFTASDSAMTIALIVAAPDGKLLTGRSIVLKVYQRIWHSVRKAETGGRYSWESVPVDSLVDSSVVVSSKEPSLRSFIPKDPGFFYVAAEGRDGRGNVVVSEAYFYASGSGYVAWSRSNDDRIELIAEKKNVRPGETAHLIIKNPYEKATALVTIEREGILRHYTTTLTGSAPKLDIPIVSDYLPNVFVSVVLLQGRTGRPTSKQEADVGRPSFKVGYAAFSVSPKEKKLQVTAEPGKKQYLPGDTVAVTILVKNSKGVPQNAEVTLSVADLGVLNLINYKIPDPFDKFYRERGLAVVTTETRMHIIEQRSYDEKGQEVGGGGADAAADAMVDAEGVRKDFRPSAYWNPSILTDSNGRAVVRFKLPDNLTAFRITAVAQTKESDFGMTENSFTVSKPLLLQPSLPRFVRVGDVFKSGVVVMNCSEQKQEVTLLTAVTGLKWDHLDSTVHVLSPGQAKEVLFSFTAQKIGSAKFIFRARDSQTSDGLQWTIPVTAPRLKETVALSESLVDSAGEESILPPVDAFADIGKIDVTAASTAMVGLSGGISYLFSYPYGCLEQKSSSILPIILANDLVNAFRFDVFKDKDHRAVVAATLDEFPLFQREDGGFSYWKNENRSWSYLSAFAMYTLVQARRNSYQVDKQMMESGFGYLARVAHGEERSTFFSLQYRQCSRALALYTLALAGKPDHGSMEMLFKEKESMPLFAKAFLLRALHAADGNKSMQDEIVRDLSNCVKLSPTSAHFEERPEYELSWCFETNTRTTALIAQALIETQPESPIIPKAIRWLVDQQKNGRWRTTQENIYVVDALASYLRAYEKDEPDFRATITLDGKSILHRLFQGRSFDVAQSSISMAQLTPGKKYPLTISKEGAGRLYYGVRMEYYPLGETVQKDEGISVIKVIEQLDGKPVKEFVPGTILKATITLSSNQDRSFVVVDDPVPAGFEPINTSFQTTAAHLENKEGEGDGGIDTESDAYWYERTFDHVEKRDDRILLFSNYLPAGAHSYSYLVQVTRSGKFHMPATRAEGMYEPEVFGQTASGVVEIR